MTSAWPVQVMMVSAHCLVWKGGLVVLVNFKETRKGAAWKMVKFMFWPRFDKRIAFVRVGSVRTANILPLVDTTTPSSFSMSPVSQLP